MSTSNIQVTKYLSNRFNFEMTDKANIKYNTSKKTKINKLPKKRPITVEAEDEAKLVKKWARATEREGIAAKIAGQRAELEANAAAAGAGMGAGMGAGFTRAELEANAAPAGALSTWVYLLWN